MTVERIWKPYGVTIHTADVDPLATIAGVTNFSVTDNLEIDRPNVDGNPYPVITTLRGRDESIQVTSLNPDDMIDILGVGGQCFKGNNTHDGVKFWLAQWDQCSLVPVAGAVHRYFGVTFADAAPDQTRGIISFESISCAHRQDAQAVFRLQPTATGNSTVAIEEGVNQTLPTFGDNTRRYTIGKMTVGGVEITGKTNFEISSNISVQKIAADSNPATEFTFIDESKPIITITGIDPTWNIPRQGIACTHANTVLYLRRRSQTTGFDFDPDNVPTHIKFTAKGRAFKTQLASGASNSPSENAVVIYPEYDTGTLTVPIVASTAQQIT